MSTLTLKKARKLLGKMADSISDEELKKEIETANLLKEIFFSIRSGNQKTKGV